MVWSPFQRDLDESIFTFGYGKSINQLLIDLKKYYKTKFDNKDNITPHLRIILNIHQTAKAENKILAQSAQRQMALAVKYGHNKCAP